MLKSGISEEFERGFVRGPIELETGLLLYQAEERLHAQGRAQQSTEEEEFELASQIGLAPAAARHSPGKPVTGSGGLPAFDWAMCSAVHRAEVKYALHEAPGFVSLEDGFTTNVLSPLVLWVQDLPADESQHHVHPYGLLDHMLEVALGSVLECIPRLQTLVRKGFLPVPFYGQAVRLTAVLGLVHDVSKVFNVEVKDPKTGETWDPMREPLAYFKVRHKLPILHPTDFRFLPGRRLNSHEKKGRGLLPLVFRRNVWRRMGTSISRAYEAYLGCNGIPARAGTLPLDVVTECVRRSHTTSRARSRASGSKPGEYLLQLTEDLVTDEFDELPEASTKEPIQRSEEIMRLL
jgi:hypothetical protein